MGEKAAISLADGIVAYPLKFRDIEAKLWEAILGMMEMGMMEMYEIDSGNSLKKFDSSGSNRTYTLSVTHILILSHQKYR
jgi:hypothetical protein